MLWRLHVTSDAHFWTWLSYSSQKSCENLVRIGWAFQELSCPQNKNKNKQVKPLGIDVPRGGLQ